MCVSVPLCEALLRHGEVAVARVILETSEHGCVAKHQKGFTVAQLLELTSREPLLICI